MNKLRSSLPLLCIAYGLLVAPTASAHGVQPVGTTVARDIGPYQLAATPLWLIPVGGAVPWVVGVMEAALAVFVLLVGGATVLRLFMHHRRRPVSARANALLTSSLAVCAVTALVAFVTTQFI
jgi:hypothetical protein